MLTLILGRAKSGKTTRLLEAVRDCPASGMAQRVVVVPEQLSHQTERRLSALCGDAISFSAEVLSFTRLYSRVVSIYGGGARPMLDGGGRLLTAKLALGGIQSQLKVFATVASRADFLSSVVSIIDELRAYEVTSQMLLDASGEAEGFFAQKLRELGLILGAYDAVTAQGACDPRDKLTLLREKLMNTGYATARHFYVDGFSDYTAQELGVLDALLRRGQSLTVTIPLDLREERGLFAPGRETAARLIGMAQAAGQPVKTVEAGYERDLPPALTYLERHLFFYPAAPFGGDCGPIRLIEASHRLEECRCCAAELARLAMDGLRWREMAVAAGDPAGYAPLMEALCRELNIPLYTGMKTPLTAHPAVAFVLCALEAATEGMDAETVTAYLRTGCSGVSDDDCDALENYAYVWNIRGARWQTPWTEHPEGYDGRFTEQTRAELERLNQTRERAVGPLLRLSAGLKSANTTAAQVMAVYRFLEDTALFQQIQTELERLTAAGEPEAAQEYAQIWNALMECLQQIVSVLGETAQHSGELLKVLRLSLGQYELGTIPAALDAVHFGSVDSLRGMEPKVLFVLGCNEGSLPAVEGSGGLLTERERRILLDEMNIQLAPDAEGAMERQLLQIYAALTAPTERLYLSCVQAASGEAKQPSFLMGRLRELFPGLEARGPSGAEDALTTDALTEWYFSSREEQPALHQALRRAAEETEALAASIQSAEAAARQRELVVPRETTGRLFGTPLALTASRLDELGNCPLSFFLNYGLKARARKEATFDAAEYGTFLHYILEQTVSELGTRQLPLSEAECGALVNLHMTPYLAQRMQDAAGLSVREQYLYRRNGREAELLLSEISQELAVSDFLPCGFELQFGEGKSLGALNVRGALGEGRLDGTVDRVDLWRGPAGDYFRIIDYKSGTKKFDYTELRGGVGLQLFLYLFALRRAGIAGVSKHPIPAGAMYFPAKRGILSSEEPIPAEAAEKLRRQGGVKRTGLILADDAVLDAMEHGVEGKYLPVQRKKSGLGDFAVTEEQMAALERFVDGCMSRSVDKIYGGQFVPAPFYRGQSHDPCRWCDYAEVCQKDAKFRREHYHPTVKPQEFWDSIGGEDNG